MDETTKSDPIKSWEEQLQVDPQEYLSLETVLKRAAALSGNFQDQPEIGGVYQALHRMNSGWTWWKMPRAHKKHECSLCETPIQINEEYVRLENGSSWDAEKYCISCAARIMLDRCEAHRYSAQPFGFGYATHWSLTENKWVRLEANRRTTPPWQPPQQIDPEVIKRLEQASQTSLRNVEGSLDFPFKRKGYRSWIDSMLRAADQIHVLDSDETERALERALFNAHSDGITRWVIVVLPPDFNDSILCIGCRQSLGRNQVYRLYGERDDYLCPRCAARTILVNHMDWVINVQVSNPYFWDIQDKTFLSKMELLNNLRSERKHQEMKKDYQRKIDQGISIEEIAAAEGRKPSTIRQRLKNLGVTLPNRR